MFEFSNCVYVGLLIPAIIVLLFKLRVRLQKSPAHQQKILSRNNYVVPSLTTNYWTQLKFVWSFASKKPKDLLPYYMELIKANGPVIHFYITGRSYVLLSDPEDLKILLSSTSHIKKGCEYDLLKPWLSEGLLTSSGSKWQNRRKLLTKAFHLKSLDLYNSPINKHSRLLVNNLLRASGNNNNGISIEEFVTFCSLDMICAQEGESEEYVHSIKQSVIDRIFKFWLWNDLMFKISGCGRRFFKSIRVLHNYTDNVIKNKRTLLYNSKNQNVQHESVNEKTPKKSFLDLLLDVLEENPDQMTNKDIREEVDTFLFEGHDTSSISMTMTIILLGLHQNVQNKARDELFEIFGDSDRDVTIEDLTAMKYLDAVIKESLRLYPSVPAISRELQTTLELKNCIIPPKTTISVIPYIIHRNENLYPNPEEFIPDRFLDEENKNKFLFGYLPFSAGPRNCIGQKYAMNQMKTVISTILRKSKIETLGRREDVQIRMELILRLDSSTKVKFHEI
ncbi:Hypothetical protein CINCED_3A021256 [Cinara cedri]|uniref:Cytochrome P450, E-class, group I,Cytochrome P450,Cytochrome P450, conserved site n=1 Tax=Cinara cedri TaxID=506608 RepID=A0A5E4NHR8_9HEMI|nr:Hypothetical protein CINCED_3A021256 [Cinara cedri]